MGAGRPGGPRGLGPAHGRPPGGAPGLGPEEPGMAAGPPGGGRRPGVRAAAQRRASRRGPNQLPELAPRAVHPSQLPRRRPRHPGSFSRRSSRRWRRATPASRGARRSPRRPPIARRAAGLGLSLGLGPSRGPGRLRGRRPPGAGRALGRWHRARPVDPRVEEQDQAREDGEPDPQPHVDQCAEDPRDEQHREHRHQAKRVDPAEFRALSFARTHAGFLRAIPAVCRARPGVATRSAHLADHNHGG